MSAAKAMKEPRDYKARKKSERLFNEHLKAGGTIESWNKMHEITAEDLRETFERVHKASEDIEIDGIKVKKGEDILFKGL